MKNNIKKFRHDIAVLKKHGLIDPSVDARKVQPTKRLEKLIDRFDPVLSGKATPVKLSKSETAAMKAQGEEVYKGRVIFPHSAGEKIRKRGKHVVTIQPNGVERVTIPIEYHKLPQYFTSVKRNKKTIDKMKREDQYFAFRFYGNQSLKVYHNIELIIDDLNVYEAVKESKKANSAKDMRDIYRNLEIVKVNRRRDWDSARVERERPERGAYNPETYQKRKAKRERNPIAAERHAAQKAATDRDYRNRLKADTAKYEEYKRKARKRAKKSRRKNKSAKKNRRP